MHTNSSNLLPNKKINRQQQGMQIYRDEVAILELSTSFPHQVNAKGWASILYSIAHCGVAVTMLIRNAVFVNFTDYSVAFFQSKLSVVDECLLTESTSKPLIDWLIIKLLFLHCSWESWWNLAGLMLQRQTLYIHSDISSVILKEIKGKGVGSRGDVGPKSHFSRFAF